MPGNALAERQRPLFHHMSCRYLWRLCQRWPDGCTAVVSRGCRVGIMAEQSPGLFA